MKETITRTDHFALTGILTVANRHIEMLNELEEVIAEIIGEERDEYGGFNWASDVIYSGDTVDEFLRRLLITIQEDPAL